MYSKEIQDKIFEKCSATGCIRPLFNVTLEKTSQARGMNEGLDGNQSFKSYEQGIKNSIAEAYVAFVDIYQFSKKIAEKSIDEVQAYLNAYYKSIIPIVKEFDGQIDKIIGDGIVVVFSEAFNLTYPKGAGKSCFEFCKKCVETLDGEECAVKAAIGSGELFFAKTIIENAYEEYSCIGHPMTVAFRLENEAQKNQILIFEEDPVNENESCNFKWTYETEVFELKGIGSVETRIYEYNAKQESAAEETFLDYLFRTKGDGGYAK